jgi:phosphoglycolate phosphatase
MKGPVEAVLFDLDGTLLDTAPDFVYVVNRLLEENQRPQLPFDTIRTSVSNGARALVSMAFQMDESDDHFPRLHKRLLELYTEHLAVATTPFPGIVETLQYLAEQEIPWGVVTNKPSFYTEALLAKITLKPSAAAVVCPEHVSQPKPHPEPLYLACKLLQSRPANSIYIGDHRRDIEAGRLAGMKTVAASYGYIHQDDCAEQWQANHCISSAAEIINIVAHYLNPPH